LKSDGFQKRTSAHCVVFWEGYLLRVPGQYQQGLLPPEVLGEAAAYVDPEDEDQISEAILYLRGNPRERQRLSELGIAQAKRFSWEASAKMTLRVYEKARELKRSN